MCCVSSLSIPPSIDTHPYETAGVCRVVRLRGGEYTLLSTKTNLAPRLAGAETAGVYSIANENSWPPSGELPQGWYAHLLQLRGQEGHVSRDCTMEAKPKACYKCGLEGHISRDCPDNAGGGSGFSSGGGGAGGGTECYRCGKVGHIARACPEAGGSGSSYASGYGGGGAFGSGGGGGAAKTCYTCGGVGHMSRDCVQGSKCYNCGGVGHISRDCSQAQKRACYTCGSEGHISRDCPGVGAA